MDHLKDDDKFFQKSSAIAEDFPAYRQGSEEYENPDISQTLHGNKAITGKAVWSANRAAVAQREDYNQRQKAEEKLKAESREAQELAHLAQWNAQKINFGGVEMTNAQAQAALHHIIDHEDEYADRAVREGRISANEKEDYKRAAERMRELRERQGRGIATDAEKEELERIQRSRIGQVVAHEAYGGITLPQLYDMVNLIQGDGWPIIGRAMLDSPFADVQRTAIEIDTKRQESQKEFGAIMGEVAKTVDFLSDPAVSAMLDGGDFSLEVLCQQDCNVYNIIPVEYLIQLAPMNRALIGAAMLYKQRHPSASGILFVIDEAATLGRFESLLRGYSFGRGMGIRMWTIWQDVGQISRNFGKDALSGFLGSSQLRQFFGVSDYETAKLISDMLGTQTLEFDQVLEQERAAVQKAQAVRRLLAGDDPIAVGLEMSYQNLAVVHRTKQARALMTPDEILAMPEDRQILFIRGLLKTPTIYAHKYPYYTRREMSGAYLPNPYHRPNDRVKIATPFGSFWRRVITEAVPEKYAHLPQYPSGEWAFVKGYRPH
jgi:hypothetical protein